MRKIIHRYTVLLLTVLLVGTGIALADTDVIVLGDVNSDGSVNTDDVTALVNYLHGSGTVNLTAADANKDGAVDIADVTAINNIITSGTSDKGTTSKLFFPATTVEKTYGDVAFTNQLVRSGSTGAITYESSVPGVATVNETTGDVTIQGAGTTIITATLAGNGGISGTTASYTLNVAKVAASITTSPASVAGDLTYDGTAQNLVTAGDASGGTLKYFVNTSGEVPTTETDGWTDVVSTGTDADTYYVWYYVAGDANHTNTAVTAIEGNTKAISKFNLTNAAIATEIGDQQYAGAQVTPAAPAIKLGESTIDASNYDVSYGENNSVGTGTVIYTAKAGSANFSGAKMVDFTITSGTLSVTAEDYSGTYDGAAHGITVTCDGATIKYRTTAEGEYNLTVNPTYTNAGTVQTVYYQVTKENYTTVEGSKTVTITQKEVTISGITASNKTYDGNTIATLDCTGATISGKVESDELTVTATGTFDNANVGTDKTVTISDITLGGSSAANYKLATSGNQESTTADITAASFTPVVTLSGWTYGSPNSPSVGETNTSGGNVTYYYKTGDAEWTTTQPTDAGTHKVKASIAASGNYEAAESAEVEFTISKATLTATAENADRSYGAANPSFTVNVTGFVNSESASTAEGYIAPTASTDATTESNVGTYDITPSGGSATNYDFTYVKGTLSIAKADITPSVTMSGWTYGEVASSPSVSGNTGNGSVTYQYKVSGADDGTYSGTAPTTPGTYTVKATIAETTNYNGSSATVDFTIASGTLTVTANDYSGTYDGVAHGITVTCEGAIIKYRTTAEGEYNLTVNPTYTNVCDAQTVYYQVTKENYTTVEGSKTVTITQKALTITANAQTIAYGNSIATGVGQVTAEGLVAGDALTAVTLTPSTDQVTTSGTITPSAAATTNGISNYSVTYNTGTLTINKVAASVTTAPTGKTSLTYTGEAQELVDATSAAYTGGTLVYSKTENGTYGAASTITETNAGTYNFWYKVQGDGNHDDSTPVEITGVVITQKALTITANAQTISYGSSIATGIEQVTTDGLVDGDALTAVTLTPSTDQVTTSGTITPSAAATTNGISNYSVTYNTGTLTINKVAASVTTAPTGKTSLTYTGEAQELVDATSAAYTGGTLVYSKTENGTYGAASTITETNAGTYSFWYKVQGDGNHDDSTPVQITGVVIGKKEVTVSGGITAENKTYDGTTTATLDCTGATISGKVESDDLTVTATGTFADANVGTGKYVTISGITLGGASAANYKLAASGNQTSTMANITAVAATVTTAPAAVTSDLTYTGGALTLFNAGSVTGGTLMYKVTTSSTKPENTDGFKTTIDQKTDAGTYYLWYYVAADGNHTDTEINTTPISKTITRIESATVGSYQCAKIWISASGGYYVVCSDAIAGVTWSTACGRSETQGGKTFTCGTKDQWDAIMSACGGTGHSYINSKCSSVTGWSEMSGRYWSSTEYSSNTNNAWDFTGTLWARDAKFNGLHVRLVSAF